jgi:hypothetical protein
MHAKMVYIFVGRYTCKKSHKAKLYTGAPKMEKFFKFLTRDKGIATVSVIIFAIADAIAHSREES